MATIKQIAQLAGVSRGTVDRVINNRGVVKPETEKRVREVIEELNYKPNRIAQGLAIKKHRLSIGVVLFGADNPYFDDVIYGINKKRPLLEDYGCDIILHQAKSSNPEEQLRIIDSLVESGVNGIVICPYNDDAIVNKINELYDMGIPVITTNTDIEHSKRLCYVGSNYRVSGKTAGGLMKLIANGNANIGIVTGFMNVLCHTERTDGFRSLVENNKGMKIIDQVNGHDDEFESYEVTKRMLTQHPEINALFISAAGVLGTCRAVMDLGRAGKIKIVSYDDVPNTKQMIRDGIISATICQEPIRQGEKPITLLFDYLAYGKKPSQTLYYTNLIIKIKENL